MEWTEELKATYRERAQALKGTARRRFMVRIVKALGQGEPVRQKENWVGVGKQSTKGWGS
jgi:hypothetical protein